MSDIITQLRDTIEASDLSIYALAKAADVPQSRLSDFKNHRGKLSLENAAKLATFFGMRLTKPKKKT